MKGKANDLRKELRGAGLSDQAIDAAWPSWWSDAATDSASANAELRFAVARNLGLSPKSLLGDRVEFVWKDNARFKHLTGESAEQQAALSSFGLAVGRQVLRAHGNAHSLVGVDPRNLRAALLEDRPFVDLAGLLALCWSVGIPVVHLRVFPLPAKSMHAMVVRVDGRYVILLGRDSEYPAPIAFTLAHEIGHIASSHLEDADAVVDVGNPAEDAGSDDEEVAADKFALALLTGDAAPDIRTNILNFSARALAEAVLEAGPKVGVEPGTLALCVAYRTDRWPTAMAALRHIYGERKPVWREVNAMAARELDWGNLTTGAAEFLSTVLGAPRE